MASLDKYKLHNNTWDSDTNPSGFWEFMFLMSATVRAIKWGSVLEDYIDVKLGRTQQHAVMTPSFITDDPDFDLPSRPEGSDGEEVSSGDTGSEGGAAPMRAAPSNTTGATGVTGATGLQSLNYAGSYYDLPADARELDSVLYSVLSMREGIQADPPYECEDSVIRASNSHLGTSLGYFKDRSYYQGV